MATFDIDQKITDFMKRKDAQFPELALMDRGGGHTVKYDHFTQPAFGRY